MPDRRDVTRRRIPAPAGRCQAFPGSERRSERVIRVPRRGGGVLPERPRRPAAPPRGGPFQENRGSAHGNPFGTFGGGRKRRPAERASRLVPTRVREPAPGLCGTDRERELGANVVSLPARDTGFGRAANPLEHARQPGCARGSRPASSRPERGSASGPRRLRAQRTRRSAATARTGRCRVAPRCLWGFVGPSGACCLLSSLAAAPRRPHRPVPRVPPLPERQERLLDQHERHGGHQRRRQHGDDERDRGQDPARSRRSAPARASTGATAWAAPRNG